MLSQHPTIQQYEASNQSASFLPLVRSLSQISQLFIYVVIYLSWTEQLIKKRQTTYILTKAYTCKFDINEML